MLPFQYFPSFFFIAKISLDHLRFVSILSDLKCFLRHYKLKIHYFYCTIVDFIKQIIHSTESDVFFMYGEQKWPKIIIICKKN